MVARLIMRGQKLGQTFVAVQRLCEKIIHESVILNILGFNVSWDAVMRTYHTITND